MRRMVWVIAMVAASGLFLATPQRAAHAASPSSACAAGPPLHCVFYESANGAPSEISDVVPVPPDASSGPAPS